MRRLRRTVEYLWPELLLERSPWISEWQDGQRRQFASRCQIFFPLAAIAYVGHYFFVDVPNNKEPIDLWFAFRMTMAALSIGCALFYFNPRLVATRWFRLPAVVAMVVGCYTQAYVTVYFPEAPWIYPYIFVFSCVLLLGLSPIKSLLFAFPIMIAYVLPLSQAAIPLYQQLSATVVCTIAIFGVRTAYVSDVTNFLLTQERDESRREIIRLGKDYEGRLKSFIPRVISGRIQEQIDCNRKTVLEATVDVLRAHKTNVTCLWSDIRGFTQGSKDIDSFLLESVIPEVKACSDAVEHYQGIPRKIGDLIFAYFDDERRDLNLLRSLLAGFDLSELNKDMNATVSSVQVKRYILISSGEAIVGNVGGLNSGVEITALGPPVNFLARLDDATKHPGLATRLEQGDLLLCSTSARQLTNLGIGVSCERVCLRQAQVEIKDFHEVEEVFILKPTPENHQQLIRAHADLT